MESMHSYLCLVLRKEAFWGHKTLPNIVPRVPVNLGFTRSPDVSIPFETDNASESDAEHKVKPSDT